MDLFQYRQCILVIPVLHQQNGYSRTDFAAGITAHTFFSKFKGKCRVSCFEVGIDQMDQNGGVIKSATSGGFQMLNSFLEASLLCQE